MAETSQVSLRSLGYDPKTPLERTLKFVRAEGDGAVDLDARTIWFVASTEEAIERWGGVEILSHERSAIRLGRLEERSFDFLQDHDWSEFRGSAVEWDLVEEEGERRLSVNVQFPKERPESRYLFEEYSTGLRRSVSIGYSIYAVDYVGEVDGVKRYLVTDWEPLELSAVTVPADVKAGTGRSMEEINISDGGSVMATKVKPEVTDGDPAAATEDGGEKRSVADVLGIKPEEVQALRDLQALKTRLDQPLDGDQNELERQAKIIQDAGLIGCGRMAEKAIREKWPYDEWFSKAQKFVEERLSQVPVENPNHIGMERKEIEKYSFVKFLRALASNDWDKAGLEQEVAKTIFDKRSKVKGFEPQANGLGVGGGKRSAFVSHEALGAIGLRALRQTRAGLDVSAGIGAELVTTDLDTSIIALLREKSLMASLGMRIISGLQGDFALPRQIGGSLFQWVNHGSAPDPSGMSFDLIEMKPKLLAGVVPVSHKMMMQSAFAMDPLVVSDMLAAMGVRLDADTLYGTGVGPEILGLLNHTGVGLLDVTPLGGHGWASVVAMETELTEANYFDGLSYLAPASMVGHFKTTPKVAGTAEFIIGPDGKNLNGYPCRGTGHVPAGEVAFGKWSEGVFADWDDFEVVYDDTTSRDTRDVHFRVWKSCDVALRRGDALTVAKAVTP